MLSECSPHTHIYTIIFLFKTRKIPHSAQSKISSIAESKWRSHLKKCLFKRKVIWQYTVTKLFKHSDKHPDLMKLHFHTIPVFRQPFDFTNISFATWLKSLFMVYAWSVTELTDWVWPVAQRPGCGVERCWSVAEASAAGSTELHWAASVVPAVPVNTFENPNNN